jgi:hypothetical protein
VTVRVFLPTGATAQYREAIATWLRDILKTRLSAADVSVLPAGIAVTAGFDPGRHGLGAVEAAAGVLDLIVQALELALSPSVSGRPRTSTAAPPAAMNHGDGDRQTRLRWRRW